MFWNLSRIVVVRDSSRQESEIRFIVAPSKNKPTELARGSMSGKLQSDRIWINIDLRGIYKQIISTKSPYTLI